MDVSLIYDMYQRGFDDCFTQRRSRKEILRLRKTTHNSHVLAYTS
jgi:hypothetical protein